MSRFYVWDLTLRSCFYISLQSDTFFSLICLSSMFFHQKKWSYKDSAATSQMLPCVFLFDVIGIGKVYCEWCLLWTRDITSKGYYYVGIVPLFSIWETCSAWLYFVTFPVIIAAIIVIQQCCFYTLHLNTTTTTFFILPSHELCHALKSWLIATSLCTKSIKHLCFIICLLHFHRVSLY